MRPFLIGVLLVPSLAHAQTTVFSTDFDSSIPAAVTAGSAALEGVQLFAGLGPVGDTFGGTFLRSPTGNTVTVQLTGLPAHNSISIDFLFAAIDSLDGTGSFPQGDFFKVTLDGNTIFRESFANASPSQFQSYVPPPGVELARHQDLGFSGPGSYYTDSAYWLGGDPAFRNVGHTASSATIAFVIEGPGIQSLGDESWAMDNLAVSIDTTVFPGSAVAYGTSCGPTLAATATPRMGQPLPLLMTNLGVGAVLAGCEIGASDALLGATPLPASLAALGMPSCFLLHDLSVGSFGMTIIGNAATGTPIVPSTAGLGGVVVFLQGWSVQPGNTAGIVTSNGLRVTVGQ